MHNAHPYLALACLSKSVKSSIKMIINSYSIYTPMNYNIWGDFRGDFGQSCYQHVCQVRSLKIYYLSYEIFLFEIILIKALDTMYGWSISQVKYIFMVKLGSFLPVNSISVVCLCPASYLISPSPDSGRRVVIRVGDILCLYRYE